MIYTFKPDRNEEHLKDHLSTQAIIRKGYIHNLLTDIQVSAITIVGCLQVHIYTDR